MDKEYEVLKVLNKNSLLSQRHIAESVGVSVGKVNGIIKKLIKDGCIEYTKLNRKSSYTVTTKGIDSLEENFKNYEETKIKLHSSKKIQINQAIVLAAGEAKDFKVPVGILEIEKGISFIDRIINSLQENNINDIIIITGYEREFYKDIERKYKIKLINNDRYKWTGTMSSLALAKDFIKGDFILIEGDHIFESKAITNLINYPERDCVLITSASGSKDEVFVEIRNEFLYKMSKDIHTLNKIDGELIGIVKISNDVFEKMIEEFSNNTNPYINYEYTLLDVSRYYDIGYIKMDDLIYAEIDNKEHYDNVKNYVYPLLKRKELDFKINSLKQYVVNGLNISGDTIKSIVPYGGVTNRNFKVNTDKKEYILRLPGVATDQMINRKIEKSNAQLVYELGVDAETINFDEETGVKISKFIEKAETLTGTAIKQEQNMRLVVNILKKVHTSKVVFKNDFNLLDRINLYENLLREFKGENFKDFYEVKSLIVSLHEEINNSEKKPCHNHIVPEDFIKSSKEHIYLIDWEYSGMNDPLWDLVSCSMECKFSEDEEELFFNLYFTKGIDLKIRRKILIYKIFQDFLWALWSRIKEAKGDNLGTYGEDRYKRAKSNIKVL